MNNEQFRDHVAEYEPVEDRVREWEAGVESLERYLATLSDPLPVDEATRDHVPPFATQMIAEGLNQRDRFVGIYLYAEMIGNHDLQIGILELLDGYEILGNLYRAVDEELGEEARATIFEGITLPPIGTIPLTWTRVNSVVFPRLETLADPATIKRILRSGLRDLPDAHYLGMKQRFVELQDIDAFLEDRGRTHLERLTKHRDDHTPYFTQMINDDVLEFVKANPEIGQGVRHGNTIVEIKIPHQSIEYLEATDLAAKQYRVCHCPVVKESMAHDDLPVPSTFCEFCPSFNAKPWEVIFGKKLNYDVLESAKRGGQWCKFAIHLPA
jgi:hypothetical protein